MPGSPTLKRIDAQQFEAELLQTVCKQYVQQYFPPDQNIMEQPLNELMSSGEILLKIIRDICGTDLQIIHSDEYFKQLTNH